MIYNKETHFFPNVNRYFSSLSWKSNTVTLRKERTWTSEGWGHRVGKGVTPKPSCLLHGFAKGSRFPNRFSPERDTWLILWWVSHLSLHWRICCLPTGDHCWQRIFSYLPSHHHTFRNFMDPLSCPSQGCSHMLMTHIALLLFSR